MSSHPTPRRSNRSLTRIGYDDPTLTGHAGLLLTGELVRRLEVAGTIEAATIVAHNLVAMLAVEVAAGNRRRLHERVANAVEEDDLRHQAPERAQPHNLQLVRRWLINVPARVVHRARQVFVRLAAGMLWGEVFKRTYVRLIC